CRGRRGRARRPASRRGPRRLCRAPGAPAPPPSARRRRRGGRRGRGRSRSRGRRPRAGGRGRWVPRRGRAQAVRRTRGARPAGPLRGGGGTWRGGAGEGRPVVRGRPPAVRPPPSWFSPIRLPFAPPLIRRGGGRGVVDRNAEAAPGRPPRAVARLRRRSALP